MQILAGFFLLIFGLGSGVFGAWQARRWRGRRGWARVPGVVVGNAMVANGEGSWDYSPEIEYEAAAGEKRRVVSKYYRDRPYAEGTAVTVAVAPGGTEAEHVSTRNALAFVVAPLVFGLLGLAGGVAALVIPPPWQPPTE